jgi:hypothetical protein
MPTTKSLTTIGACILSLACAAAPADDSSYIYPTKLGSLKFIRADGSAGQGADKITLDGERLLSVENERDKQGEALALMADIMATTSSELAPRQPGQQGRRKARRMVVLIGQGNCIKHLVILDFTGQKPFVSNRFGNDQNERLCITFKKAKWGKKESEITLASGASFIYESYGNVTGPFVFE